MSPSLVWLAGVREFLRHPWLLVLSVLGVALGVAVTVAVDLANDSALRAFDLSVQAVTGRTTHRIVGGPSGLPDSFYRRLRVEAGVRPSAPVVEGTVRVETPAGGSMRLLGLDPMAEAPFRPYLQGSGGPVELLARPDAVVLSSGTAARLRVKPGDRLPLRIGPALREVRVAALLEPEDSLSRAALEGLLLADVATAQELLGRVGRLDRIELILASGDEARVQALLPPGAELQEAGRADRSVRDMARAFQVNLQALGFLALLVGMFLIYNSVAFTIVQRREMLGILRALGVTPREILLGVMTEAVLLALAGIALGCALGVFLASALLGMVGQTLNDLYFALEVSRVEVSFALLARNAAMAMLATLAAALGPALEASLVPPRGALRRSDLEARARRGLPRAVLAGLGLAALGGGLLALPSRNLPLTLLASLAVVVGSSLLVPALGSAGLGFVGPLLGRVLGPLGRMAARGVVASLSRTAVALTALTLAVAVTVGMGVMVESFRTTFIQWLGHHLAADVYVSSPDAGRGARGLDPALRERLARTPGVRAVYHFRASRVGTPAGPVQLAALEFDADNQDGMRFVEGETRPAMAGFHRGEILVSEPLAWRRNLRVGSQVELRTDRGLVPFRVAGVFRDFGSDQGLVMIDLGVYRKNWDDPGVTSMAFLVAPGTEPAALAHELGRRAGPGQELLIRPTRDLRQASIEVFDRTFAITRVLRLLAVGVAFLGVMTALMALQFERTREVALLRSLGLTPGQVGWTVVLQTGLMGLVAGLLALPQGLLLGAIALFYLQRRSFGWTLEFHLAPGVLGEAVLLAVAASVLAGLVPAWRMARVVPAEALRDE